MTGGIKKYKLKINKKRKTMIKQYFQKKNNLNSIDISSSNSLTGSYVSYNEFALVNNVLKEFDERNKKLKN